MRARNFITILVTMLFAAGCSSGGSSSSGAASSGVNIVGKVSTVHVVGGLGFFGKLRKAVMMDASGSGCTAKAYDLTGAAILATGTADASGQFTITGGSLVSGTSYKVITSCPNGDSFTAIIGADSAPAASKTPAAVDPVTTLIATEIVNSIVQAVTAATANLPSNVQTAIINALLTPSTLANIISSVSSTVQAAIDNGTMQVPSAAASTTMATTIAGVSTDSPAAITAAGNAITTAQTAYTTDGTGTNTIPASVTSTVTGAANSAAALPACNPDLHTTLDLSGHPVASLALCTQAVAKMMYNVVHFDIAVLKSGVFGVNANCAALVTANPTAFPGATVLDGTDPDFGIGDGHFCIIHNPAASTDRNQSYDSTQGGGHDHGPMFSESGVGTAITAGVISAMGSALYTNTAYHLSDIDNVIFGASGLNARLIARNDAVSWTAPGMGNYNYITRGYELLSTTAGVNSAAAYSGLWPQCNGSDCNPDSDQTFTFGTPLDWTSATDVPLHAQALAAAIGTSTWTGSVFFNKYGGTIPTEDKINKDLVNQMVHNDWNRSGQATFNVMYSKQPDWQNPNCQWGSSTATNYTIPANGTVTTFCTAVDGTIAPTVTVDLVLSAANAANKGISQITNIAVPDTGSGKFYLMPTSGGGQYQGILQFISVATGLVLSDESMNQRSVQVILDPAVQCGGGTAAIPGIPNGAGGCTQGKMYNVNAAWNCGGMGPCTQTVTADSYQTTAGKINVAADPANHTAFLMAVNYQAAQVFNNMGPGIVGSMPAVGYGKPQGIYVTVNANGSIATPTQQTGALGASQYNIQPNWSCPAGASCSQNGFVLVNSTGHVYEHVLTGLVTGAALLPPSTCLGPQGACVPADDYVMYDEAYLLTLGGVFPYSGSGLGTFRQACENLMINNGPAVNPNYNCALDPFYLDVNGNGKLDFTVDVNNVVTCTEKTFASSYDAGTWIFGNIGSGGNISPHAVQAQMSINQGNSYANGDAASTSALIHLAFGPWLDGKHTLAATTDLNALQAFGLVYMLMSGKGDSGTDIPGILPTISKFQIIQSGCNGHGAAAAASCNSAFATGFATYHRP